MKLYNNKDANMIKSELEFSDFVEALSYINDLEAEREEMVIDVIQSIMDYQHESGVSIGYDDPSERDAREYAKIYLTKPNKDGKQ